jgi:catechol 2,3-dioxygenase
MNADPDAPSLPDATHIGRTALRANDVAELTEFYREVVGLDVLDRGGETTTLGAGGTALLVLESAPDAPARPRDAAGLYHNAFRVPTRGALGDALGRVREAWRLDGASDHRVSEALYLTDPEGNGVEIYRDFPRSAWPLRDDGTVGMGTDPLDLEALAADAAGEEGVPDGTDVGHVHLETASLERFESLYVDTVGFDVMATAPGARFVAAGGYHHHVGANAWQGRSAPAEGRGLAWFEVVLPEAAALEGLTERLVANDYDVREREDGLELTDEDGITVRFGAEK